MSTNEQKKVDFIGIGFPRSGTTWIEKCLREHPEICSSSPKETHYFDLDYHYKKGEQFYSTFFVCEKGERVVGEYTPEYIREPKKCAERIKGDHPDVKLIVAMRDPVVRSFSHYRYRKYKGGLYSSFKELIKNADSDPIVKESMYIEKLKPFLERFDRKKILFLIHEESFIDPAAYMKKVYSFLGVDSTWVAPSLRQKVNATNNQGTRFPKIEHWLNDIRWKMRGNQFGRMVLIPVRMFGGTKLITWFRSINRVPVKNPELLQEEDYTALRQYFEPSVRQLEEILDIDTKPYWGDYRRVKKSGL